MPSYTIKQHIIVKTCWNNQFLKLSPISINTHLNSSRREDSQSLSGLFSYCVFYLFFFLSCFHTICFSVLNSRFPYFEIKHQAKLFLVLPNEEFPLSTTFSRRSINHCLIPPCFSISILCCSLNKDKLPAAPLILWKCLGLCHSLVDRHWAWLCDTADRSSAHNLAYVSWQVKECIA